MFHFQDPNFEHSSTLHEILLNNIKNAVKGGGMYAFVSSGGVKILFKDTNFEKYLETNVYELIIGTDSITNEEAVKELIELKNKYENLKIKGFVNPNMAASLFHPKFSWFENEDGSGNLIIGSGNMTVKGLRQNKEAFMEVVLDTNELRLVKTKWSNWLQNNEEYLHTIDSSELLDRVKSNNMDRVVRINNTEAETAEEIDTSLNTNDSWDRALSNELLICQIPKNGYRMSQINFTKKIFEEYFGATPGVNDNYRIIFRSQNADGTNGEIESRPSVSVKSKNYRFEFDAAKGKVYPDGDYKPIIVFVKIGIRMYNYFLALPGDTYYDELNRLLLEYPIVQNRLKRVSVSREEIIEFCPELPLLK